MKTLKFQITGTRPLMLNNPRTVNPFDKYSKLLKPLTSKRTKTEDDLMEISRLKFLASLYVDEKGYFLPQECIERSIIEAAKERKLGKKFERSFNVIDRAPLDFKDNKKKPEQLFDMGNMYVDVRAVGIKNARITTTRAIIPNWSATFECWFDETQLDEKEVLDVLEIAGLRYGVGTYRRLYGRFSVKKI